MTKTNGSDGTIDGADDFAASDVGKYEIFFNISRILVDDVEIRAHALILSQVSSSERYVLSGFLADASCPTFRIKIPGTSRVVFGSIELPVDNHYLGMRRAHLMISGCQHRIVMFSPVDSDVGIQAVKLPDGSSVAYTRHALERGMAVHRARRET